ncbi:unnamed protein product [Kuraishia capsulata CBS 1993]|uniref:Rrp15p-domain-containing protein n=1 Tax=Kuraishia capsulata CBS 1993 TaxID=1382522 RepID=W6MLC2_9ASCO|nr:uncharacterized protein KUCA_T00003249001 [Kuraishia capsulata CBS 1993]CDK27271.1 unnamed protein product [Kuraishia capsulata CBS 1993]
MKKGSITLKNTKANIKATRPQKSSKASNNPSESASGEAESSGEELDLSDAEAQKSDSVSDQEQDSDDSNDSERERDSDSEEEFSDSDEDEDDEIPQLKKRKGNPDDGSEQFSTAVNALLGTHLKAYDRKDPILARSKSQIKKFETEKLELKARKALLAEKKQRLTKDRVRDLFPKDDASARFVIEREKRYKKTAQRGVIKLFNAVLATQTQTANVISKEKIIGDIKKDELITELSKEKFLDLIQEAGKN